MFRGVFAPARVENPVGYGIMRGNIQKVRGRTMDETKKSGSELALLKSALLGNIDSEGKRLKICLMSTYIIGLIAHAYGFLHLTISDDSLNEFYLTISMAWKLQIGRFMEPLLRYVMGEKMTLLWLTGLAGLLFAGLAVHFVSKMFSLDRVWENILLSGIIVTNITVTALIATYAHDFAGDMLALLLAVYAAYAWKKQRDKLSMKYTLAGAICLMAVLGFYQAYIAFTITLLCIETIVDLMKGVRLKNAIARLLRALPMGVLAVVLYYSLLRLSLHILGYKMSGYYVMHKLTAKMLLDGIKEVYRVFGAGFLSSREWDGVQSIFYSVEKILCCTNLLLLAGALEAVFFTFRKNAVKWQESVLAICLIVLLPVCMLCASLFSDWSHDIMHHATCLIYLFILVALKNGQPNLPRKHQRNAWILTFVLISAMIVSDVQIANMAYQKKELERYGTLSKMTRILSFVDQYEGYDPESSEVALIGWKNDSNIPLEVGRVESLTGTQHRSQITYRESLISYLEIVLQCPLRRCSLEKELEIVRTKEFQKMTIFPDKNCIATIDGVVVVKISNDIDLFDCFDCYYDTMNMDYNR